MPRIMHQYKLILEPGEFPDPVFETVECPKCHWRMIVDPDFYDWKVDADLYREMYRKMYDSFVEDFEEAGRVYNLPLREWFEGRNLIVIARLKAMVEELRDNLKDDIS